MNVIPQINNSQIQNNQNYNDILQQLNNEKLKNKKYTFYCNINNNIKLHIPNN